MMIIIFLVKKQQKRKKNFFTDQEILKLLGTSIPNDMTMCLAQHPDLYLQGQWYTWW
jgi:hypothetical protein